MHAGQVDVVMVYKLDRLTRSVVDLGKLIDLLKRRRVDLVSLQESLDATTATGELMMNLPRQRQPVGTQGHRRAHPRCHGAPQGPG